MRHRSSIMMHRANANLFRKPLRNIRKNNHYPVPFLSKTTTRDTGTFDVIIKDVYSPKGVRIVQVPIWSPKDGQDDIRWYEAARQANGDYKVSIKAKRPQKFYRLVLCPPLLYSK